MAKLFFLPPTLDVVTPCQFQLVNNFVPGGAAAITVSAAIDLEIGRAHV